MERDECTALILGVVSRGTGREGSVLRLVRGLSEIFGRDNVEEIFGGQGGCKGVRWTGRRRG